MQTHTPYTYFIIYPQTSILLAFFPIFSSLCVTPLVFSLFRVLFVYRPVDILRLVWPGSFFLAGSLSRMLSTIRLPLTFQVSGR